MDEPESDRDVRHATGMSAARAARFARVCRGTLERYEMGPQFVSDRARKRCSHFYAVLRAFLAEARDFLG